MGYDVWTEPCERAEIDLDKQKYTHQDKGDKNDIIMAEGIMLTRNNWL